jgi:hypothetical protein
MNVEYIISQHLYFFEWTFHMSLRNEGICWIYIYIYIYI